MQTISYDNFLSQSKKIKQVSSNINNTLSYGIKQLCIK